MLRVLGTPIHHLPGTRGNRDCFLIQSVASTKHGNNLQSGQMASENVIHCTAYDLDRIWVWRSIHCENLQSAQQPWEFLIYYLRWGGLQLHVRLQCEACKDMHSRPHLGPFHSTCRVQLCLLTGQSSASEFLPRKVKGKSKNPSSASEMIVEHAVHLLRFQHFPTGSILWRTYWSVIFLWIYRVIIY